MSDHLFGHLDLVVAEALQQAFDDPSVNYASEGVAVLDALRAHADRGFLYRAEVAQLAGRVDLYGPGDRIHRAVGEDGLVVVARRAGKTDS